jgi:hypothetical protein
MFCVLLSILWCAGPSQAQEKEKNYSISLVKTAEKHEGKEIHNVGDRKVLTQEYTVQEGDHVWQLFRERGLLQKRNLPELLSLLKKMNKSLDNIDLIHPGQKIIIPLKIAPIKGTPVQEETVQIADLKDLDFRNYTVKKDDSVLRVIRGMYRIPEDDLYKDYLRLVRKMNPEIKDLDTVYPGQSIRLPVYSPEVLRVPIKTASTSKAGKGGKADASVPAKAERKPNPVAQDLAAIFVEMGEEWIQSGQHFIPLKTGGQINLKADSFPLINLRKGHRVIVDLDSNLPPKMARLIESSWNNYGVVHLTKDDDLRSSLDKTLMACKFPKINRSGEPLEMGKDFPIRITGDWIVTVPGASAENKLGFVVINLRDGDNANTPPAIRNYLEGFGVKVIDYPGGQDAASVETGEVETLKGGEDPAALLKTVFDLTGQPYSVDKSIPVYQSSKDDLNLIIRADFFLKVKGKDAVINFAELEPEAISLLEEQGFMVLSLAKENDSVNLIARTCKFLGIQFQSGPHHFMAVQKEASGNIRLTLPGVIFSDSNGESILATKQNLPDDILTFLSQRRYRSLVVSF